MMEQLFQIIHHRNVLLSERVNKEIPLPRPSAYDDIHICDELRVTNGEFWHADGSFKTLGLQKLFVDDRQVRWCLKTYACLALISEPSVIDEFQKITNFVDYYKGNFIGRQVRNQRRRAPRFPIAIWNCISRLDQQLPRTNNSNEGWHRAIHPGERIRQWILSNPMGSDSPMEPDRILERGPIVGSDGKNYFLTHDQISILCHQSTRVIFQSWIPLKSNIGSNTKDPTVGPCPGIP
ncbi:unnamed protein product [Rotaria socialis]|uniref:Uncharacterized protein n=1 Tax=Rotaria socialis TaxID=392032 RepID=A0A821NUC6_9BILA|nr:unnamed protein product [Rotaria socialis]